MDGRKVEVAISVCTVKSWAAWLIGAALLISDVVGLVGHDVGLVGLVMIMLGCVFNLRGCIGRAAAEHQLLRELHEERNLHSVP